MIKVITTVGTSLFENFKKKNSLIRQNCEALEGKEFSKLKDYKSEAENIKKEFLTAGNDYNASAEIKTLMKIKEEERDDLEVYFLCTDTILSNLAAQIIKEKFSKEFISKEIFSVQGLQIDDFNTYDTVGFSNLINKFKQYVKVAEQENTRLFLNLSGGYKAIIPPLTILGQIYRVPLTYIYEDSNDLIYFPSLPIHFDWSLAEEYYPYLQEITKGEQIKVDKTTKEMKELHIIKQKENEIKITPLGKIFKDYVESEMPLANNALGYFVEYKLFEYYLENIYENRFKNVTHSKRIENKNEKREIDLILKDESSGQIVTLESKSFLQVYRSNDFQKLIEQINAQIKILKEGSYNLYQYHLAIYHTKPLPDIRLKKQLSELKTMIENAFDNKIKFKAFQVRVDLNLEDRDYYKNPYQKFLSQPILIRELKNS